MLKKCLGYFLNIKCVNFWKNFCSISSFTSIKLISNSCHQNNCLLSSALFSVIAATLVRSLNNCKVKGRQFWCLFFKRLKEYNVENFWGPQASGKNQKNWNFFCKQNLFFQAQSELYMFSAFIWGILHHKNSKCMKFQIFLL